MSIFLDEVGEDLGYVFFDGFEVFLMFNMEFMNCFFFVYEKIK